ncbi:MAG: Uncharacterised protein [Candidatus Poseidoniaceae archaeon]|nr:MAG: Uncharacterised protein [Candidatus Poseidoniaceae archaeon]
MSEATGHEPIARWRVIASLTLILQIVILLSLKSALEEDSWFIGTLSTTVEEGPLSLEGVSANITIDMQNDQDDISIELFGPLRLSHWQDERDDRAALSEQEIEEYDDNLDEAFSSPSPDTVKSMTFTVIHVSIGLAAILFVLICIDLTKQVSGIKRTIVRRFVSFASLTSVLSVLVLILFILPASWFATVADNPQDFTDSRDNVAFLAHAEFSSTSNLGLDGFTLDFEVTGYDIGMVRPANRSAVEATIPEPTSPDAGSYIVITGDMRTETPSYISEMVYFWLALWVLVPLALLIQQRVAIDSRLGSLKR